MPNHITTEVEISGTKEKIADLVKKTKLIRDGDVEENHFDFNGILPMPPELTATTSPTTIVPTQEEADEKNKADIETAKKNNYNHDSDRYISQEEADRRMKKYNALNWYDYANRNWGTKWNCYEVKYTAGDDTKIVIQLDTAWDTPRGIWEELERQGFTVKGVMYGEMDGYDFYGAGDEVFEAYQNVEVEYVG
jgi:hypothetical protein